MSWNGRLVYERVHARVFDNKQTWQIRLHDVVLLRSNWAWWLDASVIKSLISFVSDQAVLEIFEVHQKIISFRWHNNFKFRRVARYHARRLNRQYTWRHVLRTQNIAKLWNYTGRLSKVSMTPECNIYILARVHLSPVFTVRAYRPQLAVTAKHGP